MRCTGVQLAVGVVCDFVERMVDWWAVGIVGMVI
jgi:hypothetical protein